MEMLKKYFNLVPYRGALLLKEMTKFLVKKTSNAWYLREILKSERLTALRKKYEAFIEEDKKRKERNEYILGKLDKMTNTQTRRVKLNPDENFGNFYHKSPERFCLMRGVSNTTKFNSALLNEIVEKYILIPKHKSTTHDIANYKSNIDDPNWKSKYEILYKLSKNENEENMEQLTENNDYKNETPTKIASPKYNAIDIAEKDVARYDNGDSTSTPIENVASNIPINAHLSTTYTVPLTHDDNATTPIQHHRIKPYENEALEQGSKSSTMIQKGDHNPDLKSVVDIETLMIKTQRLDLGCETQDMNFAIDLPQDSMVRNDYVPEVSNFSDPVQETHDEITAQTIGVKYNDELPMEDFFNVIEIQSATELVNELENPGVPVETHDQYPMPIVNPEQFTPDDGVQLVDETNINPVGYEDFGEYVTQAGEIVSSVDPSLMTDVDDVAESAVEQDTNAVEEFEAEQKEMWLQPANESDQEKMWQQSGDSEFVQDGVDQSYANYYFEQQDPPVNEYEETQHKYDPNYEQQYTEYNAGYQQETPQYDVGLYHEGYERQGYEPDPEEYVPYEGYKEGLQEQQAQQPVEQEIIVDKKQLDDQKTHALHEEYVPYEGYNQSLIEHQAQQPVEQIIVDENQVVDDKKTHVFDLEYYVPHEGFNQESSQEHEPHQPVVAQQIVVDKNRLDDQKTHVLHKGEGDIVQKT